MGRKGELKVVAHNEGKEEIRRKEKQEADTSEGEGEGGKRIKKRWKRIKKR